MIGGTGKGMTNAMVAVPLSHWGWPARVVRGTVLSLRRRDQAQMARMVGAGRSRSFLRCVPPATLPRLMALASLDLLRIMLRISSRSFPGVGLALCVRDVALNPSCDAGHPNLHMRLEHEP